MPTISIIIPVYNVERYLRRCLDSVLAQTFADWECVLVDDGSPDRCPAICDEYAARDGRFRVLHQENTGVAAARNAGLDAARGAWIGFVDSDDWCEPAMYAELYRAAAREHADIAYCNVERGGRKIVSGPRKAAHKKPLGTRFFVNEVCMGALWNKLINARLFKDRAVDRRRNLTISEDLYLMFQLFFFASKSVYVHKVLYHYRVNPESATSVVDENYIAQQIMVNGLLAAFCGKHHLEGAFSRYLRWRECSVTLQYVLRGGIYDFSKLRERGAKAAVEYLSCPLRADIKAILLFAAAGLWPAADFLFRLRLRIKNMWVNRRRELGTSTAK